MFARVSLLLLLTLSAGAGAAEPLLRVDAQLPRTYSYRNAFGETEHYLVARYLVSNPGSRAVRYHGLPVSLTVGMVELNDGFRPLVQAAFCRETGCDPGCHSTAEIQGASIFPHRAISGIAIFQIRAGDLPSRVHMRAGNGPSIELRRTTSAVYASVDRAVAAPESARENQAVTPETQPPIVTASAWEPESREKAPRSWRVVHSAIPQPSENGR